MNASKSPPGQERWTTWHSLAMLLCALASWCLGDVRALAIAGALSLVVLLVLGASRWTETRTLGAANAITLVRVVLVVAIAWVPAGPVAALVVLSVLALDGLDGWMARHFRTASAFGAKFDMETDALLVAVVCLKLGIEGRLGPWILVPGLLRYAYALGIRVVMVRAEAPRSQFGRYVFVVLVLCLALSLWPIEPIHRPLSMLVTALTVYSFARSFFAMRGRWGSGARSAAVGDRMRSPESQSGGVTRGARSSA